MGLISKTIANLINGVSQQPATIRNPTQCEAQVNILSDTTYGNVHRPHTKFLKRLSAALLPLGANYTDYPTFHLIERGATSQHQVMITSGDLKVFDALTGVEKTVSFPNGKGYLASTNPRSDFQCLTIGLNTYILNRTATTTETTLSTYARPPNEALIFVKQGDYSTDYTVKIAGSDITISPPSTVSYGPSSVTKTTSDTVAADVKTAKIATDLMTGLDVDPTTPIQSCVRVGSTIWIYTLTPPANHTYTLSLSCEDSKGNNNLKLIRSAVQKFSDLPTIAPQNYVCRVVGDKTSSYDDYHVVFNTDDAASTFGTGAWSETFKDGHNQAPLPSTMPLVLIDNENGTFTCKQETWGSRLAGDSTTNPPPSFIGKKIQFMFTFGNRLGFLSGGNTSMSAVGAYTNFYSSTVITFLDDDPIDIRELNGFSKWLYAIPLAEKVILFSEAGQAVLSGGGLLTPKTVTIQGTTEYPTSSFCTPVVVGDSIYATADSGTFSRCHEFYIQKDVDKLQASEITSHVPQYLPVGVSKIAGDFSAKLVAFVGTTEPQRASPWTNILIYKPFWIGDQKVQSCWSKWDFVFHHVLNVDVIKGKLYTTLLDPISGDVIYSYMDLDPSLTEFLSYAGSPGTVAKTHLDCRLGGETLTTSTSTTFRTFTLPFSVGSTLYPAHQSYIKVYRKVTGSVRYGDEVPITGWASASQPIIDDPLGDIGTSVWIGIPYKSLYRFSEIHLKEDQNGNQIAVEAGNLTIKKIDVLYNESYYFRVKVTPDGRSTRTYVMTPYVLGDPTHLGDVARRTGSLSVPVASRHNKVTIDIINDSVVGHRIQSAEWTGNYTILSQRR